eukprot:CAMPEP_0175629048 /NCGR_PEP_ID=MMETSP0096-20121207/72311_1 /TAXON_ID=311494 /ORGANISM="Alexandrium monilatum, Strain CCMP3105" /LENGTH=197 /DNA_ID=CAMNT_0016934459 /DNA_START=169 /DNA_END=764 /DNA_ORIENTATION=-
MTRWPNLASGPSRPPSACSSKQFVALEVREDSDLMLPDVESVPPEEYLPASCNWVSLDSRKALIGLCLDTELGQRRVGAGRDRVARGDVAIHLREEAEERLRRGVLHQLPSPEHARGVGAQGLGAPGLRRDPLQEDVDDALAESGEWSEPAALHTSSAQFVALEAREDSDLMLQDVESVPPEEYLPASCNWVSLRFV